jgi:hypothetical protein
MASDHDKQDTPALPPLSATLELSRDLIEESRQILLRTQKLMEESKRLMEEKP